MIDPTETARRQMLAEINAEPGSREFLEAKHGQVWDTSQLSDDFEVIGFMAPVVVVRRRSDGAEGQPLLPAQPSILLLVRAAPTVTPPTRAGTDARPDNSDKGESTK